MNLAGVALNWFDLAVVGLVAFGAARGRKGGMSEEALPLIQWLAIILGGGHLAPPLGSMLAVASGLSAGTCTLVSYGLVALVLSWLFTLMARAMGEKLTSTDAFGRLEYPAGIVSGGLRYLCMAVLVLALFSGVSLGPAGRAAATRPQDGSFGRIAMPSIASLRQTLVEDSLTGRLLRTHASQLLLQPVPPGPPARRDTFKSRRQGTLDEVTR